MAAVSGLTKPLGLNPKSSPASESHSTPVPNDATAPNSTPRSHPSPLPETALTSVQSSSPSQAVSQATSGSSSKKYACSHCPQTFTRQHNLKSHLLIHSQEKKFTCETCSSKFRRIHDLKRHLMLHTGERPYLCKKCGRRFARGDALIRHTKASGICSVAFVSGESKDEHSDLLEKQLLLPVVSGLSEKPHTEITDELPHRRASISGITNSPPLPSIMATSSNSNSTSANTPEGTSNSQNLSTTSLSLPPISASSSFQSVSPIQPPVSFQRRDSHILSEERTQLFQLSSPVSKDLNSDSVMLDDETKNQAYTTNDTTSRAARNSHTPVYSRSLPSHAASSPIILNNTTATQKSSDSPSIVSISPLMASPYSRRGTVTSSYSSTPLQQSTVSSNEGVIDSATDPSKSKNALDSSAWQIIRMLENRVRALEERLNSSEGRVSFLESQLSNLR